MADVSGRPRVMVRQAPDKAGRFEREIRTLALALGVLLVCGLFFGWPLLAFSFMHVCTETSLAREPSPDGRYEVIAESRNGFLDSYERLWITTSGEQDRSKWLEIAPEVDGNWAAEWLGPNELMLTNYGWPQSMPYGSVTWRDVRIEHRPRPTSSMHDAPDEMHRVDVWTYRDSYGERSAAALVTNWQNPRTGWVQLVEEGPWRIEVTWAARDRLDLQVVPIGNMPVPEVPAESLGITITVNAK